VLAHTQLSFTHCLLIFQFLISWFFFDVYGCNISFKWTKLNLSIFKVDKQFFISLSSFLLLNLWKKARKVLDLDLSSQSRMISSSLGPIFSSRFFLALVSLPSTPFTNRLKELVWKIWSLCGNFNLSNKITHLYGGWNSWEILDLKMFTWIYNYICGHKMLQVWHRLLTYDRSDAFLVNLWLKHDSMLPCLYIYIYIYEVSTCCWCMLKLPANTSSMQ